MSTRKSNPTSLPLNNSNTTSKQRFKLSISDLLLLTFGVALAISAFRNYPWMWGSCFWISITTAIVCCCTKQVGNLILGRQLPFPKDQWDLRIGWLILRLTGVILLSLFLVVPPDNYYSNLANNFDSSDFSKTYSDSILGGLANSIGPIGVLFCLLPLSQHRSRFLLSKAYTFAIGTLVIAFLLFGVLEAMTIHGLIHIATTGIENGMLRPAAIQSGERITEFDWNIKISDLTKAIETCIVPVLIIIASTGLLVRYRKHWASWIYLAVCLTSNYFLAHQLLQIYNQEIANLNFVWKETVAYPEQNAMIAVSLFCLFCGFFIALRSGPSKVISDPKSNTASFTLPLWLLLVSFVFSIIEAYIYSQWNPFEFWFGRPANPEFLGIEIRKPVLNRVGNGESK